MSRGWVVNASPIITLAKVGYLVRAAPQRRKRRGIKPGEIESIGYDKEPDYLLRDRDAVYGKYFRRRVKDMGIEEVLTAYRSPWQNPYVERLIGSIRREWLDYVIIFNEKHLRRVLTAYFAYYHRVRPHQSLDQNAPFPRKVGPPEKAI